jgi:hypothetical protein
MNRISSKRSEIVQRQDVSVLTAVRQGAVAHRWRISGVPETQTDRRHLSIRSNDVAVLGAISTSRAFVGRCPVPLTAHKEKRVLCEERRLCRGYSHEDLNA